MATLSSYCYDPMRMNQSTGDVLFMPDAFCDNTTGPSQSVIPNNSTIEKQNRPQDRIDIRLPEAKTSKPKPDRYATFGLGVTAPQQLALHPAFRERRVSGRAGDIGALDDQIARKGGTTSTIEELPHRLQISKKQKRLTPAERVVELTRTNGYLLQELAYHKDARAAEMRFYEKVIKLRAGLEDALKERAQTRTRAEASLLDYWGIDQNDCNVEDPIF